MATVNPIAENVQLASLLTSLFGNVFGKTSVTPASSSTQMQTTSGGTQTTSGGDTTTTDRLDISKEGIDALLRDLMEDDSTGFARVASGQKIAGLYNTTSRNMLLNDLLTRSAGQVAKLTAPKVSTTTRTPQVTVKDPTTTTSVTNTDEKVTKTPGILGGDAGTILGILGGVGLANKLLGGKSVYDLIAGVPAELAYQDALSKYGSLPSGTDYYFPSDITTGNPMSPDFIGPASPFGVGDPSSIDFIGPPLETAAEDTAAAFASDQIGELGAEEALAATENLAPELAMNNWQVGLPIAFAVANADKLGNLAGSAARAVIQPIGEAAYNTVEDIASPVQDLFSGIFGFGGGDEDPTQPYGGWGSPWDFMSPNYDPRYSPFGPYDDTTVG